MITSLNIVLSQVELPPLISLPSGEQVSAGESGVRSSDHIEILYLLRIMLAQALNQQDRNLVAQLHETIRCVSIFDEVKLAEILFL